MPPNSSKYWSRVIAETRAVSSMPIPTYYTWGQSPGETVALQIWRESSTEGSVLSAYRISGYTATSDPEQHQTGRVCKSWKNLAGLVSLRVQGPASHTTTRRPTSFTPQAKVAQKMRLQRDPPRHNSTHSGEIFVTFVQQRETACFQNGGQLLYWDVVAQRGKIFGLFFSGFTPFSAPSRTVSGFHCAKVLEYEPGWSRPPCLFWRDRVRGPWVYRCCSSAHAEQSAATNNLNIGYILKGKQEKKNQIWAKRSAVWLVSSYMSLKKTKTNSHHKGVEMKPKLVEIRFLNV